MRKGTFSSKKTHGANMGKLCGVMYFILGSGRHFMSGPLLKSTRLSKSSAWYYLTKGQSNFCWKSSKLTRCQSKSLWHSWHDCLTVTLPHFHIASLPPTSHLKHGGHGPTPWNEQKQLRCHAFLCRASANWCESIHSAKSATNIIWLLVQPTPLKFMMEWVSSSVGMMMTWMTFHMKFQHEPYIIPIKNNGWHSQKNRWKVITFPWWTNGSSLVPVTTQSWRLSARWLMNRPFFPYRGTSWFRWNSWSLHLPPVRTGHMVFLTNLGFHARGTEKKSLLKWMNLKKMMESSELFWKVYHV